jgi:hypothetical protein
MAEALQNQVYRGLKVEFVNSEGNTEMREFGYALEASKVNAGDLKEGFLRHLDGTSSPLLEPDEGVDENTSYHLVGVDAEGEPTALPDEESVDLNRFTHFQIYPRTTGGAMRLGNEPTCF